MRRPCWLGSHDLRQSTPAVDGMAFVKCIGCGVTRITAVPPDEERDKALENLMLTLLEQGFAESDMERCIRNALRPMPRFG